MQQFRQWNQMNVDYGALILVLVIILPGTLTAQPKPIYQIIHTGLSTRIMRLIQDQGIFVTLL
jgi:hypothetical protein